MPACSIVNCGSQQNKNQPVVTLHRFPKNENLKRKWLEVIGIENLNTRPKVHFVCSLHFEESSFNRTLDVVRLRDNTVPSINLMPHKQSSVISEQASKSQLKVTEMQQMNCSTEKKPNIKLSVLSEQASTPQLQLIENQSITREKMPPKKFKKLVQTCKKQRAKIKRLHELVRKRDKKIANLNKIIEDLTLIHKINNKESLHVL